MLTRWTLFEQRLLDSFPQKMRENMNCRGSKNRYLPFFQIHPHQFVASRNPELSSPDLVSQFRIKSLSRNQDDQTQKSPRRSSFSNKIRAV